MAIASVTNWCVVGGLLKIRQWGIHSLNCYNFPTLHVSLILVGAYV